MYLEKLELQGFKSFATPAALEFKRGVSAIVGPNGSGKSNVADALRFVLGEQSMKTIRSKKAEDLIFSGSPTKARMSAASVALHFNNEDRAFPVEFGTVVFRRKVFRDGENQYFLNDAQVRLRDLQELIAKAKLGLKGYTIINQGMGDAILDASPKERKEIFFEALGLKEFQLKRAEALLKLGQTNVNLQKAQSVVREIEPHLRFLKKQAEKIDERQELETKLKKAELSYIVRRKTAHAERFAGFKAGAELEERRIADAKLAIEEITRQIETADSETSSSVSGIAELEEALLKIEDERNATERELGKVEGMLSAMGSAGESAVAVDISYVREGLERLHKSLASLVGMQELGALQAGVESVMQEFDALLGEVRAGKTSSKKEPAKDAGGFEQKEAELLGVLERSGARINEIKEKIRSIRAEHGTKREDIFAQREKKKEQEHILARAQERLAGIQAEMSHVQAELEVLEKEQQLLESAGGDVLIEGDAPHTQDEEEMRRNIERLKVRLENIDLIDTNVRSEYEETQKRYEFLVKESGDLTQAVASLHKVIAELDETIAARFREAFSTIGKNFSKYFSLLFGGGTARLEIVTEEEEREEGEGEAAEEEKPKEYGVELDVSLPRKKTSGLSSLSGGERALTALSLLFALVSTSPPPFLVLDEIDAPLDEANSVRFAKILTELREHTQFVVITHNRETMRQSDILYGVTMQEDGVSKLLSLKFEAAREITG